MGTRNSDEQEIANLIFRYAELVDAADFDGVGEMFALADYGMPGALVHGTAIGDVMRRSVILHDGLMRTKHVTTNLIIEFDDSTTGVGQATCRSYFTVMQATETLPLQPVITGRYSDTFASDDKAGGSWHFIERLVTIEQIGDVSQHLRRPPR